MVSKWSIQGKKRRRRQINFNKKNFYKKALNKLFEVSKLCSKRNLRCMTTANRSITAYTETIRRFLAHRGTPSRNLA